MRQALNFLALDHHRVSAPAPNIYRLLLVACHHTRNHKTQSLRIKAAVIQDNEADHHVEKAVANDDLTGTSSFLER